MNLGIYARLGSSLLIASKEEAHVAGGTSPEFGSFTQERARAMQLQFALNHRNLMSNEQRRRPAGQQPSKTRLVSNFLSVLRRSRTIREE